MYKTALNNGGIFLQFAKLGFVTRLAFYNICLGEDKGIAVWQLDVFWDHGILSEGLEDKIYNIIEKVKVE